MTTSTPTITAADRHARTIALLAIRANIASKLRTLSTLAEVLAEGYLRKPADRKSIGVIASAADCVVRQLVASMAAERHIAATGF